jgi:hypothetical protein
MFLTYGGTYDYSLFRKRIIQNHLGIEPEKIPTEYFFNLYDREFGCDLLDELDLSKKSKAAKFDLSLFKDRLDSDLKPKDFNLPQISPEECAQAQLQDVKTVLGLYETSSLDQEVSILQQMVLKDRILTELSADFPKCELRRTL